MEKTWHMLVQRRSHIVYIFANSDENALKRAIKIASDSHTLVSPFGHQNKSKTMIWAILKTTLCTYISAKARKAQDLCFLIKR